MTFSSNFIFKVMLVISWAIFIGLCIEAGGLIVNFAFSLLKPEYVQNLYLKLDLSAMLAQSKLAFYGCYSIIISLALLKVYLFFMVAMLVHKIDLNQPFSEFAANKISQISYFTLSIGLINFVARQSAKSLTHHNIDISELSGFWVDTQAWILMSAVIYIISYIFNRGVEIQKENELTV